MRLDAKIPIRTPTEVVSDNLIKNTQSIDKVDKSPVKPISDFAAIISRDVPMASFIGILDTKTGIIII